MRIGQLYWDDDDNNVNHLLVAHGVTPDEVHEIIDGVDGEPPAYRTRRDGEGYLIFGETGGGRLLILFGHFVHDSRFRVCSAREMSAKHKRDFRKGV